MKKLLNTEPSVLIAALIALIGVGSAFGLAISDKQTAAIVAALGAVLALVHGVATRSQVYSTQTHQQTVADALSKPHPMAIMHQDDFEVAQPAPVDVPSPDVSDAPQDAPVADVEPVAPVEVATEPVVEPEPAPVGPTPEQIQTAIEVGVQAGLAHIAAVTA